MMGFWGRLSARLERDSAVPVEASGGTGGPIAKWRAGGRRTQSDVRRIRTSLIGELDHESPPTSSRRDQWDELRMRPRDAAMSLRIWGELQFAGRPDVRARILTSRWSCVDEIAGANLAA